MNDTGIGKRWQLVADVVVRASEPLGVAELVRRMGLPKTTVLRTAGVLVRQRVLSRSADGYRPGPWLAGAGARIDRRTRAELARPALEDLRDRTGAIAYVSVAEDVRTVVPSAAGGGVRSLAGEVLRIAADLAPTESVHGRAGRPPVDDRR